MYGKQYMTLKKGGTICKYKNWQGVITDQIFYLGDIIFIDKYQTSFEGCIFSQRGHDLHQFKFFVRTLFYDDSSKKIFTYNQV